MLKTNLFKTAAEICLIVTISMAAGIAWNWTLLKGAWRGEPTKPAASAAASTSAASATTAELLPMPIGLMQVKEFHDANEAVLVDARSAAQFADGHIPGALLLPVDQARKSGGLPAGANVAKDATVIVYCNGFSCHDSMEVGKLLMQSGYSSVYVYEGGYPEWRDAGYTVARGEK